MKVTFETTTTTILTLTEAEASWLSGLVQNKLVNNETQKDAEMRKLLFEALNPPTIREISSI